MSKPRFAIRRISSSVYVRESVAVRTPFFSSVERSPKYKPPVSSRMIIISKPPSVISSFKGQAPFNSSYNTAGLKFANRFNAFLIFSNPASGLLDGSSLYQGDVLASPPIDPSNTASLFFASSIVSSVNGTPYVSIDAPPIKSCV